MIRKIVAAVVGLLLAAGAVAMAQTAQPNTYVPPPGVEFQIHLYPITKFRGAPQILTKSTPRLRQPLSVESILLTRGIWELCSDFEFRGRCVRIQESRIGIPVAIVTRSARLVGDTGPLFAETPVPRPGPDVALAPSGAITETRPAPAPVVAPSGAASAPPAAPGAPPPPPPIPGVPGTNTSLAGREVEFFPAPAKGGFRVLACAQAIGSQPPAPRCVQATADGFCAEQGYRDSGWREMEMVNGRAYLSNVLCKRAADSDGARDSGGAFSIFRN